MIQAFILYGENEYERASWDQAPGLLEWNGRLLSLRAGPRTPQATDRSWDPIAIYAPDEFTEEEFQELFAKNRQHIAEFNLKY